MRPSGWVIASLVAAGCMSGGVAEAVHFVPPADGPVPFHRDQLPIDANAMSSLSRQLVTLAGAQKTDNVPSLQTVARLLALAQALDPQNRDAEDLANRLKENKQPHPADAQAVDRATNRAWQIESWLDSPESGPEGKSLAKCLLDVMAAVDPEHPKSAAARVGGLQGKWEHWIAPASEFEEKALAKNDTPKQPDEHPSVKPKDDGAKSAVSGIRLAQATVTTPLWVVDPADQSQKAILKPVKVRINATSEGQGPDAPRGMQIQFEGDNSEGRLLEMSNQVLQAVKNLQGEFPRGGKATIVVGKSFTYYYQINHNMISAAEAVLVDSTLLGEEPSATVIGVVDADGSFKSPPRFWELLRSLSKGQGGRLVIPRECAPMMLSVLAVEDPGFFFKYEVISASNLKELVDRAAKRSASPLDEASAKFNEIREKLGTSQVGAFVANRFVRQRLVEVAQAYPDHISAKMLAIQGAGERPTRVPRVVLAAEIRKAVLPAFGIASKNYDEIDLGVTEGIYEGCKKNLEELARYEEIRDRPLAEKAGEMLTSIRTFVRAKRNVRAGSMTWNPEQAGRNAYDAMVRNITSYQRELMAELGERQPQESKPN